MTIFKNKKEKLRNDVALSETILMYNQFLEIIYNNNLMT